MKKNLLSLLALVLLLGVFIISCDEDILNVQQVEEEDKETVADNSEAELKVARVFENINNFAVGVDSKKSVQLDGCPVTITEGDTVTIDFTGCTDGNDGKIIAIFSVAPSLLIPGMMADITFDSYVSEGIQISGKLKMTVTDTANGTFGPAFTIEVVENMTFGTGNDAHTWEAGTSRTIQWVGGYLTPNDNTDDVFNFSGNSSGTNSDGIPYEVNISTPFVFDMTCEWIKEGKLEVKNNVGSDDEKTLTIDFSVGKGDETGECDAWVSISSGSLTVKYNIAN